ncbi:6-phosphofructokinase [Pseudoflavonifractor sp. 524-17]|uniref:6-phosphofructokinase n=1 Tax=Pseudoflavonifractor sp. 524-17 TaxID=2304577 RepID=UPI00137B21FD|nr:6-phosphofructokinase [Pseudoflavonifractor sp. 524-17]NCE64581.1 6-phosphofructokinase [Pseudoflavonifractor sp. 524-17]
MESKQMRRIGVFTSGGDAPGMNAAVRSVVRTALHMGIECVGIRRGYYGLINCDIIPLDFESVSGISRQGGTMLYSARSEEFYQPKGREKAVSTCKLLGIDGLVGIGGDGTFRGLLELSKLGVSVVGIPGTIDNDISCSTYTIGFDTACNTAQDSIDKLRDTMQSHERCSVVEVMGRHAGHLALYVGVACGATAVVIPEQDINYEHDLMEPIRRARLNGRTHFMVIVAEGVEGGAYHVAEEIRNTTALDTRVTILGHVQRGGSPSSRDRVTATHMGYEAVELLAKGMTNRVICLQGDQYVNYDIAEALAMRKSLDPQTYTVMRALTGMEQVKLKEELL